MYGCIHGFKDEILGKLIYGDMLGMSSTEVLAAWVKGGGQPPFFYSTILLKNAKPLDAVVDNTQLAYFFLSPLSK